VIQGILGFIFLNFGIGILVSLFPYASLYVFGVVASLMLIASIGFATAKSGSRGSMGTSEHALYFTLPPLVYSLSWFIACYAPVVFPGVFSDVGLLFYSFVSLLSLMVLCGLLYLITEYF